MCILATKIGVALFIKAACAYNMAWGIGGRLQCTGGNYAYVVRNWYVQEASIPENLLCESNLLLLHYVIKSDCCS